MSRYINNLADKVIKQIIREATELNEISRNKKHRRDKDIERFFRRGIGGFNGIKQIVVLTAENPNSISIDKKTNRKLNKSLIDKIKESGYIYVPAMGTFEGNKEHPYAVFNIDVEVAKTYCGLYEQTSFIVTRIGDDGEVVSDYYEKNNRELPYDKETNDYELKETCKDWIDMSDAKDNFTIIGKHFKYSIPFRCFEEVNETILKNCNRIVEQREQRCIKENVDSLISFSMRNGGSTPFLYRRAINSGFFKRG